MRWAFVENDGVAVAVAAVVVIVVEPSPPPPPPFLPAPPPPRPFPLPLCEGGPLGLFRLLSAYDDWRASRASQSPSLSFMGATIALLDLTSAVASRPRLCFSLFTSCGLFVLLGTTNMLE
jgi:hypothetical protein